MKLFTRLKSLFRPTPKGNYYRTNNGVYARVTGERTFLKSWWMSGEYHLEENTLEGALDCASLFSRAEWTQATPKQWDKHTEPLAAKGTGTRSKKPIRFEVECGGRQYFSYKNDLDMPEGRRRELEIVWLEYAAQADRDYLLTVPEAILAAVNSNPVKIGDVVTIANDMKAKITMTFDFTLYEKLASVLYFDVDEDTSRYDMDYNAEKIAHWRKTGGMDFFLSLPISDLLPKSLLSTGDLNTSLAREQIRSKLILSRLAELSKKYSISPKGSLSGKPKPEG